MYAISKRACAFCILTSNLFIFWNFRSTKNERHVTYIDFRTVFRFNSLSAVVIRIQEVSSSDPGPDTGYPNWEFCAFPQSLHANDSAIRSLNSRFSLSDYTGKHDFCNNQIF